MKTATLLRIDKTNEGTFGHLTTAGGWWYTLENPWLDNKPFVSCIPEGVYTVSMSMSSTFKRELYLVEEVLDRSGVRIHEANRVGELQGCIALGNSISAEGGKHLVNSGAAVDALHKVMDGDPFKLVVKSALFD